MQVIYKDKSPSIFFYSLGRVFGQLSFLTYLITLLPGIGDRFELKNIILSTLKIYRRYIGILMFLFAVVHVYIVKYLFSTSLKSLLPQATFEVVGVIAFSIFLFLFFSSNNISMIKLKIWWYRIHRFTYLAMFFIFLHVSLVRFTIFSVLMIFIIILQVISFLAVYKRTHSLTGGKPI